MPRNSIVLFLSSAAVLLAVWISIVIPYKIYEGAIWPVLLGYLGICLARSFFFIVGVASDEILQLRSKIENKDEVLPNLGVSIVVPAYNEGRVIREALLSLAKLNYTNYEIIVVDDGSNDDTHNVAKAVASEVTSVRIEVIKTINGGKSSALNVGIQHSAYPLILCVDADSKLHPDSLNAGVKHFVNPEVAVVAGFVQLSNHGSFILNCQKLEYRIGLNFMRSAYSFLGIVPIVPGPIGLFRREVLVEMKGYTRERNNFAEDAELTLRIISKGRRVVSESKMIAYTEAPSDWRTLMRQRYRWTRGTFQAIRSSWEPIMTNGTLKARLLVTNLLFESWIVPIINLCLTILFVGIWLRLGIGSFFTTWMAMMLTVESLLVAVAVARSDNFFKGLVFSFVSRCSYDILLMFWKIACLFDEWTDQTMHWDKLTRTGSSKG